MRTRKIGLGSVAFLALALGLLSTTSSAVASEHGAQAAPGGVDVQTYRPAAGPGGLLSVEGADTADHLQAYGGLFVDYLSNPLTLSYEDGSSEPIVDHRMNAHMLLGIGAMDRFQFELAMPVVMVNQGQYLGESIGGGGPGDLGARAKANIFSSLDQPVGLGAMLDLTFPTGATEAYRGSPSATVTPRIIGDTRFDTPAGPVLVAANVGTRLRSSEQVHNMELGSGFVYGAGAEVEVVPQTVRLGLDLYGSVGFGGLSRQKNPLEMLLGAKFDVANGVQITAGGGLGLVGGVGSPQWRALTGVTYRPASFASRAPVEEPVAEPTEEVVEDECPPEPEGFAGRYDDQGCAITPATFEGCKGLDEDWAGEIDKWGCPLLDSDGDGYLVEDDECPTEPVVFIEGGSDRGCPVDDVDGDGVANVDDLCPLEPGLSRYDGCPPPKEEEKVERGEEELEINDRVHFESNKAIIARESYDLLQEVALVISKHPDILVIEVAGHTDARGDANYNMMLSKERAQAVREFLIKRGNLRPGRVIAEGYGQTDPLIDEDSDEAHAENRRVEFRIIETEEENQ